MGKNAEIYLNAMFDENKVEEKVNELEDKDIEN